MTANTLVVTIEATHESLAQRLREANRALQDRRPREPYMRMDALMAATSRHLAAAEEVLVPEATQRLSDGAEVAEGYLADAHRLEESMLVLKGRLYGEVHVADLPWDTVWTDARESLARHNDAERALVTRLADELEPDQADDLATRVYRAELRAPTRAHPFIPHTGVMGRVARRVFATADRFWDVAQSRVVPPPVRPKPRSREHESLMSQFLTGEPTLDPESPVLRPHQPRRRRGRAAPQEAPEAQET